VRHETAHHPVYLATRPGIWGVAYSGRDYARLRLDQVRVHRKRLETMFRCSVIPDTRFGGNAEDGMAMIIWRLGDGLKQKQVTRSEAHITFQDNIFLTITIGGCGWPLDPRDV
jgi:hypothetical protein